MYMGVRLVKWSVMYMGVRVVKWSVMYMGVRLVKWSVMYEVSISKTLSIRDKEWQTLKCQ
jgi:hypothetical protein